MPTNCEIVFDNTDRVFYGGQLLCGRVTLSMTKEKTVRGVYIEISGKASVHWSTGAGKNKRTHSGNETYLEERTYFVGGRVGDLIIEPGTYIYTFQCLLPMGLPTSFEGPYGHIRYSAIVTLDRPRWPDQVYEQDFTVIKPLNLNNDVTLRQPVIREENEFFNRYCLFFCCSSGPLQITARLPVSGYTPGQNIQVALNLTNNSDESVSAVILRVHREEKYQTHVGSVSKKSVFHVIGEKTTQGCQSHQKEKYTADLLVPPTPPTDFDDNSSSICKVRYYLTIECSVKCCHTNPTITIPIIIGTYPISEETVLSQQPLAPTHNQFPSTSTEPTAPFPDDDPPTYEQAVAMDDSKFTPSYPVYRRATSYSSKTEQNSNE